ncbi:MAG: 8-amino-7-oxononanoate synthase [Pseudorhodoplanes sp.]|nr:8-amino-7-oxononanoate synthase [Pseudorhodoplanes sp.]
MNSLDQFARDKLSTREADNLRRHVVETAPLDGISLVRNGRRLLAFCTNDYLNLSQHPAVKAAAAAAVHQYGAGAGASRLITGSHPLYAELERRLARLKGTQAACVFGSGYLANTGILPALADAEDLIVCDELSHSCIRTGASLSRARVMLFRHNDVDHAAQLLAGNRARHPRAIVATEGVFSMDGDLAPLAELSELAQRHDAWLLTDDAHGIGVVGNGRGSAFAGNRAVDVPLQMGTLSKAIGGYGGYLCASEPVIALMHNRARTFIYTTGLPPSVVATAIAALDIIENEPDYAALPLRKARLFTRLTNLPDAESAIVPVMIGDTDRTLAASRLLEQEGFLVIAIRPPTVPAGTARLRFTFSAAHADADIERLATIVRERIMH